ELTGWRRLPLVTPDNAAALARALTERGLRSSALVQLAEASGETEPMVRVARTHAEDRSADKGARIAAMHALGRGGTEEGARVLRALSQAQDDLAGEARAELKQRHG